MIRFCALILVLAGAAMPASAQPAADAALVQKARAIHDRVITLDTHDDINPTRIVPIGPDQDLSTPHGRDRLISF